MGTGGPGLVGVAVHHNVDIAYIVLIPKGMDPLKPCSGQPCVSLLPEPEVNECSPDTCPVCSPTELFLVLMPSSPLWPFFPSTVKSSKFV